MAFHESTRRSLARLSYYTIVGRVTRKITKGERKRVSGIIISRQVSGHLVNFISDLVRWMKTPLSEADYYIVSRSTGIFLLLRNSSWYNASSLD